MAKDDKKLIRIIGRVSDRKTKAGLAGLRVEAWDKDLIVKKPFMTAVTDQQGSFTIEFKKGRFKDSFGERRAPLFFKIFRDGSLVANTQDTITWSPDSPDQEIAIQVETSDLSGNVEKSTFTVRGQITRGGAGKFSKGIVRAFDTDVVAGALLGETRSDDKGNYVISYTVAPPPANASRNPDLIIGAFDDQLKLVGQSDVRRNAKPDEIINFEIPAEISPPIDKGPAHVTYTVEGLVSSPDRAGVGGLTVRIVNKNVGGDILRAETSTKERGNYNVSFHVESLLDRCKEKPDLQARVYSGQTFLAASNVRYYADTREILNVTLPANSQALPSEHETLVETLRKHCAGVLANLQETDDRQDITYLANKTGWDARAVALAALADQFSRRSVNGNAPIPPSLFYALFRAGLPANEDILFQTNAETLTAIWNKAAEQAVIPKSVIGTIPQAIEYFRKNGRTEAFDWSRGDRCLFDETDVDYLTPRRGAASETRRALRGKPDRYVEVMEGSLRRFRERNGESASS